MSIWIGLGGDDSDFAGFAPGELQTLFSSSADKITSSLSSFSVSFRLGEDNDTCVTYPVVKTTRGNTDIAFNSTFHAKYSKTSSSVPKTLVKSILNKLIS
jgi:hypothetical protein